MVSFLSTQAEHRGTELRSHTPVEVLIGGDADQLRQVEINLMLNAPDAAGREGVVEVMCALTTDRTRVQLTIDDSGDGVSDANAERIFEPFFSSKAHGSGLGLPISHSIVEAHGGHISLGTSHLGGAHFTVHFLRARVSPTTSVQWMTPGVTTRSE